MRAAQRLHLEGIYHGSLLKGSKEEGFTLTDNVRVSLVPEDNKNSMNGNSIPKPETGWSRNGKISSKGSRKGKGKASPPPPPPPFTTQAANVIPNSTAANDKEKKQKRMIQRVLFVNFEDAFRHAGHHCPSTNENLKMIRGGGCPELDNIYEYFLPYQINLEDVRELDRKSSVISSI